MSLDYAILGFLNYHPQSGYDLKKTFDVSVQHFWSADQSQIYRTLARLTQQGLVEVEKIRQEDRPDRKVYHITDTGRAALREWISGPPPVSEPRSAPLIQVFFMGLISDEEALERFERFAQIMRMILVRYEDVPDAIEEIYQDVKSARERFFWQLTLENVLANMRANLEWAESVIERIRNGEVPPA